MCLRMVLTWQQAATACWRSILFDHAHPEYILAWSRTAGKQHERPDDVAKEQQRTDDAPKTRSSEAHVRQLVHEFVEHYHHERNHQGRDNQLLQRPPPPVNPDADVERRERRGGLLSFYYREAARGGG